MAEVVINSRRLLPPKQCATAVMRSVNDNHSEAAIQTARPAPVSVVESTGGGFRTPTEQRWKKVDCAVRNAEERNAQSEKRNNSGKRRLDRSDCSAAQPQPQPGRHRSRHLEGDAEGEGGHLRRPGIRCYRQGMVDAPCPRPRNRVHDG